MTSPVALVRAQIRQSRGRPGLADLYTTLFALALLVAIVGSPVVTALGELARRTDPAQAGAGLALVTLGFAGVLTLARALGPVAVSAADAAWLLLSPLDRRGVLSRTAGILLGIAVLVGAALALGLLVTLGAPDQLVWRVIVALILGVSASVGGLALAVLAQSSPSWDLALKVLLALLAVVAIALTTGMARHLLGPTPTTSMTPHLLSPTPFAGWLAAPAVLAVALARRAWSTLSRIPLPRLLAASARTGHVTSAAAGLDPSVLAWIAEDTHWRGRSLHSRPWPALAGRNRRAAAVAWLDWRRVGRRPGRLLVAAGSAVLPLVMMRAGADGAFVGVAVMAGALAVAASGVSGARRDADNPALARLLGVAPRSALTARSVLPALLGAAWITTALGLLTAAGAVVPAWWAWGPLIAPAVAAGALRMARRKPIDHSLSVIDLPLGPIPLGVTVWLVSGLDLAVLGSLPAVHALTTQPATLAAHFAVQAVVSVAVLAGYLRTA